MLEEFLIHSSKLIFYILHFCYTSHGDLKTFHARADMCVCQAHNMVSIMMSDRASQGIWSMLVTIPFFQYNHIEIDINTNIGIWRPNYLFTLKMHPYIMPLNFNLFSTLLAHNNTYERDVWKQFGYACLSKELQNHYSWTLTMLWCWAKAQQWRKYEEKRFLCSFLFHHLNVSCLSKLFSKGENWTLIIAAH